jgi:hypothetical protein
MDASELAHWIRDDCLANTGIWFEAILTVGEKSDFDIETPDGTKATITIEVKP